MSPVIERAVSRVETELFEIWIERKKAGDLEDRFVKSYEAFAAVYFEDLAKALAEGKSK
jgi:hypothetical protein